MSGNNRAVRESDSSSGAPERRVRRLAVVEPEPPLEQGGTRTEGEHAPSTVRGPLLAVCGLCGGAGASTVAYLIALAAARADPHPVLVGDTGGPSGGLSCYAGVAAQRSLVEAAEQVAAGLPTGQLVATTADGLRVLATEPRFTLACAREGVERLLEHARERYALTVIDCGTLAREADQVALAKASHVAWVLPATASGARRGGRVLEAVNPYLPGREMIIARHDERGPKAAMRDLRRLAEQRQATLVLVPSLPDLPTGKLDRVVELAQVSLQAIERVLAR
jgi:Flp pilus assembly CpaE family ATPase